MRLLAILACVLIASMAVAGCANKPSGNGTSSSSHSGSASASASGSHSGSASTSGSHSSSSSSSGSPSNHAPTGSISASVGNGSLPLKVNFTVSGSDADGDTIVWDLTFGDGNKTNGTSLPKTVSHNYTKAGNFTASLMVTDGKDHTTSNVTIHVAGGGGAGGSQDATVKYTVGQGFCGGTYPAQAAGTDTIFGQLAVDASTYGKAFTADWTFATPGSLGVQVIFKDAAGTTVGDVSNVLVTSLADKVPALAVTAWFSDCGPGGPASVAYHAG